jgi:hypothetical protein
MRTDVDFQGQSGHRVFRAQGAADVYRFVAGTPLGKETPDEARRIAVNFAKLPKLLRKA